MTEMDNERVKIDRLSSLPPELLFTIFDLAYDPDQLLLEPLSRRLLPYFRRNLYRQIRLSSRSSWTKLRRTIKHSPEVGEVIESLDISAVYSFTDQGQFEENVKPFPRLTSLKTGYIQPMHNSSISFVLPPLNYLSYECQTPDISALTFLANLNLSTLEINFHSTDVIPRPLPLPRLESLKQLSLVRHVDEEDNLDDLLWRPSLINIIDSCPNITSLRFFDPCYPDYRDLLSIMTSFAARLTSLELDSSALADGVDIACDDLLPHFSNLVHLSLGEGTVSRSLPSYLRQLPLLTSLRLGPESHWNIRATEFFSLLRGPTRLPTLRHLEFECFEGQVGRRTASDGDGGYGSYLGMREDGWIKPVFLPEFTKDDAQELLGICKENVVKLNLDLPGVFEDEHDYELEEANRSALRSLQLKSLEGLTSSDGSPRFPHIPIDNLDPHNLKLVKTELPEKNWFRLSLE